MKLIVLLSLALVGLANGMSFLSVGDQGYNTPQIALAMGSVGLVNDINFVVGLGDNFYPLGVTGLSDPQWNSKFVNQFSSSSLQVPWYVTTGNHDYYGNQSSEIAYTQTSNRWNLPNFYYTKTIIGDQGLVSVDLFSIDTWRLNGGDTFVRYDTVSGKSFLRSKAKADKAVAAALQTDEPIPQEIVDYWNSLPLDLSEVKSAPDTQQYQWINQSLQASKAQWKIVFGHFPIHSSTIGEHGDTKSLVDNLLPILQANHVDIYFCGHDHTQQHIVSDGLTFFVNGAGAQTYNNFNMSYPGLKHVQGGQFGFMLHTVTPTSFTTSFINQNAGVTYSATINK